MLINQSCCQSFMCSFQHIQVKNIYFPLFVYDFSKMSWFTKCHSETVKRKLELQSWTKLVETRVENPVNSRNGSIFQIQNSPPYPLISMLNLVKFCCQKPKTLQTTLIWGKRGFFRSKINFLFCLNSFVQDCRKGKI